MVPSYHAIAPLYDRIMAHVDYDQWLELIIRIKNKYLCGSNPSILELGGGTGVQARLLENAGFKYTGSDISFPMCTQALTKGLPFFCADARHIPVKSKFDLIIFLYDGINYFLNTSDYAAFFEQAYSCLNESGYLLFDITTEANSLRYFTDLLDYEDLGGNFYVRHSYYEKQASLQYNEFTVFLKSKKGETLFERYDEKHVQRVLPVSTISNTIPRDKFDSMGIWDGYSFRRHNSRSDRVHFFLKKVSSH